MQFETPLIEGRLLRRYKRFLADMELDSGERITAHTSNTGSMLGCAEPGSRVWLSRSENAKRKYPLSWEIVEANGGTLVGINTALPGRLVREAIEAGIIGELQGYARIRAEVPFGVENSRVDLLLERDGARCYVELKNVTAIDGGAAIFPDAVTRRGAKHLRELVAMAADGHRAVIFYCVQRGDASEVRPADAIDPDYGRALRAALAAGVEAIAYRAAVTPAGITLEASLPVVCP